jgi:DNA-binding response OmpR family regulator
MKAKRVMAIGNRVFVVEDEPLVSALICDMLEELGYEVAATARDVASAIEAAKSAEIDVAILDLALEDGNAFPVAEILHHRRIPFIFATGLDLSRAREALPNVVVLKKPFGATALDDALKELVPHRVGTASGR